MRRDAFDIIINISISMIIFFFFVVSSYVAQQSENEYVHVVNINIISGNAVAQL